ncbi:MAG TPA: ATP-binding protein [Vicinamibacterales bacterium]|nr:ATP-binding protein [Vicinamibacterales bacterium]
MMLESRFGMYIAWGPDYTQFYNDGYRPILGSTKHPAVGRSTRETFRESWHIIGPLFDQVMKGEAVGAEDWMLPLDRHGYLEECFFTFSYSPIREETGAVGGVLVTVTETTPRVLGARRLRVLRELATGASITSGEEAAWRRAAEALAGSPEDVPFAQLYAIEGNGARARLANLAGPVQTFPPPARIERDDPGATWPLFDAWAAPVVIDDVRARAGDLFGDAWPEPVESAVVLPIGRPSEPHPYGFLVAGVSPRRALDAPYRDFLELAADHIATGVSNARAHETERRRAEGLAELDRAKTVFFSNVSHEFRTPLTLLLGPIDELLAGREGPLPPAVSGELQRVHRNAQRLLKLVNMLLEFSRIEAGRVEAVFEPTDLSQLTTDLASVFRSAVERAGLAMTIDCPPVGEQVFVDREMWEKVLLNLLSNALKFTFEGGISVSIRRRGDEVDVAVRDTGVGIPASELPLIFERFHRVTMPRARTHEGSGIGLALVQELVRLHGGRVEAASEVGRGTTFVITLPLGSAHLPRDRVCATRTLSGTTVGAQAYVREALRWLPEESGHGPDAAAVSLSGDDDGASLRSDPARIIVADDNADMREYLVRLLSPMWQVEACADGEAALSAIAREVPDLVIADVMMPRLDGFELLEAVRSRFPAVPVVLLSARAGEEARVEGLSAGADDYIVKPFSARELLARISSQLTLARARRLVREERARLYELFMQAPTPICVLRGPELVFEMANAEYQRVSGDRPLLGLPLLEAMPELTGQGLDDLLREVMRSGRSHSAEERLVRLDRRGRLVDTFWTFTYAPLRSAEGRIERVMVVCHEVTDQVMARRELEMARHEAEKASRAKDEFLAMLGHELRNPLSPMLTAVELMRRRGGDLLKRERTVIERQVEHLVRLVDDLLDVSRITRGKVELRRAPIELRDVVAKAVELASPLLESRRQRLTTAVPSGAIVDADGVRLAQVFSNLLTNASKYSEIGSPIEVTASVNGGQARVSVRDRGIGIPQDLLPRIFHLFVQGEQSLDRAGGGLGLGLTIVKSLVEMHGGSVEARSDGPGCGSEFVVTLPVAAARTELGGDEPGLFAPAAGRRRRVLVVDDNRDAAEMLAEMLRMAGYETRVAYDGPNALRIASTYRPEIALLDIGLPVMDGYELARHLRGGVAPGVRLVAVTGYGTERDQRLARQAGFDAHLVKPVDLDVLANIIELLADESSRGGG